MIRFDEIKKEATLKGLDYNYLTDEIKRITNENGIPFEKVNYIDISIYNIDEAYIWLAEYDKNNNKCNYFNNANGFKLENIKKADNLVRLKDLFILNRARFGEYLFPVGGYYFQKVENNKPSTLKKYINNNFCYFIALDKYNRFKKFSINEDGKTTPSDARDYMDGVDYSYTLKDANDIRINAIEVYAVYNEVNIFTYKKAQEKKHNQRQDEKYNKYYAEYLRSDKKSVFDYKCCNFWRVSYSWYKDSSYNRVSLNGYEVDITGIDNEKERRDYIYNIAFDKSGYFKLDRIDQLKKRLKEKKYNQECEAWKKQDKSDYLINLEAIKNNLVELSKKINKLDLFFNSFLLDRLKDIKSIFDSTNRIIEKLKNNEYKTLELFNWDKSHLIERYNIILIINNDLNILDEEIRTSSDYKIKDGAIVNYWDFRNYKTPNALNHKYINF